MNRARRANPAIAETHTAPDPTFEIAGTHADPDPTLADVFDESYEDRSIQQFQRRLAALLLPTPILLESENEEEQWSAPYKY